MKPRVAAPFENQRAAVLLCPSAAGSPTGLRVSAYLGTREVGGHPGRIAGFLRGVGQLNVAQKGRSRRHGPSGRWGTEWDAASRTPAGRAMDRERPAGSGRWRIADGGRATRASGRFPRQCRSWRGPGGRRGWGSGNPPPGRAGKTSPVLHGPLSRPTRPSRSRLQGRWDPGVPSRGAVRGRAAQQRHPGRVTNRSFSGNLHPLDFF
jgi:hypothetical protein